MIIHSAKFVKSAVKPAHYPPETLPEIAFSGRSNVGKSSLINTLVNRKRLVRTSRTPGRTQLINFFAINDWIMLVDLPGYGYAKVPTSVRKNWQVMIEGYLTRRGTLKGVILLLDIRRLPDERERLFVAWLKQHHRPVIPVLTKSDKLSKSARKNQCRQITKTLGNESFWPILFSAKTREGRQEVWDQIKGLIQKD